MLALQYMLYNGVIEDARKGLRRHSTLLSFHQLWSYLSVSLRLIRMKISIASVGKAFSGRSNPSIPLPSGAFSDTLYCSVTLSLQHWFVILSSMSEGFEAISYVAD